jgi:hypothetical protein
MKSKEEQALIHFRLRLLLESKMKKDIHKDKSSINISSKRNIMKESKAKNVEKCLTSAKREISVYPAEGFGMIWLWFCPLDLLMKMWKKKRRRKRRTEVKEHREDN